MNRKMTLATGMAALGAVVGSAAYAEEKIDGGLTLYADFSKPWSSEC